MRTVLEPSACVCYRDHWKPCESQNARPWNKLRVLRFGAGSKLWNRVSCAPSVRYDTETRVGRKKRENNRTAARGLRLVAVRVSLFSGGKNVLFKMRSIHTDSYTTMPSCDTSEVRLTNSCYHRSYYNTYVRPPDRKIWSHHYKCMRNENVWSYRTPKCVPVGRIERAMSASRALTEI